MQIGLLGRTFATLSGYAESRVKVNDRNLTTTNPTA